MWWFHGLEDERRPNGIVSRGGINRASYDTTNLSRRLKEHEAEYVHRAKKCTAATESKLVWRCRATR